MRCWLRLGVVAAAVRPLRHSQPATFALRVARPGSSCRSLFPRGVALARGRFTGSFPQRGALASSSAGPSFSRAQRSSAASQGRKKLKAYFINTDLDEARRRGAEETCRQLGLDCRRVVPPQLRSAEVQRCAETTPLRAFECSLVHAHRSILRQIRAAQDPAVVLEDDARLNGRVSPQHGQDLLARVNSRDFVMMGWCDPSCAHAYFVSPAGATMLLGRGFESPRLPADSMFPAFEPEDVLFPERCPGGHLGSILGTLDCYASSLWSPCFAPRKAENLLDGRLSLSRSVGDRDSSEPAQLIQEDPDHAQEQTDSVMIDEVKVKALQSAATRKNETHQEVAPVVSSRSSLLKAVSEPQACCAALASLPQSKSMAKPATEIMRPLVFTILQESEEMSRMIDTKRDDMIVAFMEQCREGVRDADGRQNGAAPVEMRMREIEETSVKVFETLAKRAELLVDSLTKSPSEFWKVWTTFYPALSDFSESSPIFESALYFFKRRGSEHVMVM
ncbi:unnamed protein product [Effrenium voratum]|nr:unnamed protein product [Effrenium voratum]